VVFIEQVGVTTGNMEFVAIGLAILLMAGIFMFEKCTGYVINTTYTKNEREDTLNALAISLLLARDEYQLRKHGAKVSLRTREEMDRNNTIFKLVNDLKDDVEFHENTYPTEEVMKVRKRRMWFSKKSMKVGQDKG
jgi:hypothetical protein